MNSNSIFHSQTPINCYKVITQLLQGKHHIKWYNKYIIPFHCQNVNLKNRSIRGDFLYPVWKPINRAILYNGGNFRYTFFHKNDLTIEIKHQELVNYNIYSNTKMYPASIKLANDIVYDDSFLLFTLPKDIAEPLIHKQLI
jgi:hypothetical protein